MDSTCYLTISADMLELKHKGYFYSSRLESHADTAQSSIVRLFQRITITRSEQDITYVIPKIGHIIVGSTIKVQLQIGKKIQLVISAHTQMYISTLHVLVLHIFAPQVVFTEKCTIGKLVAGCDVINQGNFITNFISKSGHTFINNGTLSATAVNMTLHNTGLLVGKFITVTANITTTESSKIVLETLKVRTLTMRGSATIQNLRVDVLYNYGIIELTNIFYNIIQNTGDLYIQNGTIQKNTIQNSGTICLNCVKGTTINILSLGSVNDNKVILIGNCTINEFNSDGKVYLREKWAITKVRELNRGWIKVATIGKIIANDLVLDTPILNVQSPNPIILTKLYPLNSITYPVIMRCNEFTTTSAQTYNVPFMIEVNGDINIKHDLIAPEVMFRSTGNIIVTAVLAAVTNKLQIYANSADLTKGKLYGAKHVSIEIKTHLNQGSLAIAAEKEGQFIYKRNTRDKYYIASGNTIDIKSNTTTINGGLILSGGDITLYTATSFTAICAHISAGNNLLIDSDTVTITRVSGEFTCTTYGPPYYDFPGSAIRRYYNPTRLAQLSYIVSIVNYCPASGPTLLESMGNIIVDPRCSKFTNSASDIVCSGIYHNQARQIIDNPMYYNKIHPRPCYMDPSNGYRPFEMTTESTVIGLCCAAHVSFSATTVPNHFVYGCNVRTSTKVIINTGKYIVTASINSPIVSISASDVTFLNANKTRNLGNGPLMINIDNYNTPFDFPVGNITTINPIIIPQINYGWVEPLRHDILRVQNLNPLLQRVLAHSVGKSHIGGFKGYELANGLLSNSYEYHTKHPYTTRNKLRSAKPMLVLDGPTLCISVPETDVSAKNDADIITDHFICETSGDQTYINNQVIASSTLNISGQNITRRTEKYTEQSLLCHEGILIHEVPMPQQTFISKHVQITASNHINEIGAVTLASNDIIKQSTSITKSALSLTANWSNTIYDDNRVTYLRETHHSYLPTQTIAGNQVITSANNIHLHGSKEIAGKLLKYEGISLIADTVVNTNTSQMSSIQKTMFSTNSSCSSTEQITAAHTTLSAPQIEIESKSAIFSGVEFIAEVLRDCTENGMDFTPIISQVTNSNTIKFKAPMRSFDKGSVRCREIMTPCKLIVSRVVRDIDVGKIKLNSVDWNKSRTTIIGRFAETVYELKSWHTEWNRSSGLPNSIIVIAAIIVSIYTGNLGLIMSSMITQAATSMLQHGDIGRILNGNYIKSVATDVLTGGIGKYNAGLSSIYRNAFRAICKAGIKTALGTKFSDAIKHSCIDAVAASIAGEISSLKGIEHKIAHFALGAGCGYVLDGHRGAISGGSAAVLAEVLVDVITPDNLDHQIVDDTNYAHQYLALMRPYVNMSQIITTAVISMCGGNPLIASTCAINSLEYNTLSSTSVKIKKSKKIYKYVKKSIDIVKVDTSNTLPQSIWLSPLEQQIKREYENTMQIIIDNDDGFPRNLTATAALVESHIRSKYAKWHCNNPIILQNVFPMRKINNHRINDAYIESTRLKMVQHLPELITDAVDIISRHISTSYIMLPIGVKIPLEMAGSLRPHPIDGIRELMIMCGVSPWLAQDTCDMIEIGSCVTGIDVKKIIKCVTR